MLMVCNAALGQKLKLNDLEYFERQGVTVLVYNNTVKQKMAQ
jgi:hypothetical protein